MGVQAVAHIDDYRGDRMNIECKPHRGHVVEIIKVGNTVVQFCNDYITENKEEIENILTRYQKAGWEIVKESANREKL